ncbi:LLM class flavin-dependent oxidoreductase [Kribbella koreensis]|uniref:LLM class flavin-dependent oxidoreductase n=2 Tax=Kribbella TaxID=182639 RepID=A0ABP6XZT6_9ACTN
MILPGGTAQQQLEQAVLAEESGWDGVFVWEAAYGVDAWGLLSAIAVRTSRIRLGTMLTPLPWRRPWKVASQVVTLDQLSGGRATLAVGVGATGLAETGEELDLRTRAAMLDEGIDLIRELWAGRSSYHGVHYDYESDREDVTQAGGAVQERIPIWVVGVWPRPKSMARALRCDGLLPQYSSGEGTPEELGAVRTWLNERGAAPEFEVIAEGETAADDPAAAAAQVAPWAEAGATWWLETRWEMPHHSPERMRQVRDRLIAGPPSGDPG